MSKIICILCVMATLIAVAILIAGSQFGLVVEKNFFLLLGSSYVYQFRNKVRDICAMDLFLQVGLQNTLDNVLLKLIAQIINEPCFNILRTKLVIFL